jgi:7-cyano-7-deazaguanine synthase
MKKWILLFSGGLDSTTLLYDLKSNGDEIIALTLLYGQRHKKEIESAESIAKDMNIQHMTVDLSSIRPLISNSSQTGQIEVPEGHYTEESMKLTVVPNRNMIFLSMAIGLAVNLKFDGVAYAAHSGDHAIYPDCRREFVDAMAAAAKLCDWHSVEVNAPYLGMSKSDIVKRGNQLDVPYEKTWSCYKGQFMHCGKCGTCVERIEAFELAEMKDPTHYEEMASRKRISL